MTSLLPLVAFGALLTAASAYEERCEPNKFWARYTFPFQGTCYTFVTYETLEYADASNYCRDRGAVLAMPKTAAINNFLVYALEHKMASKIKYWIGVTSDNKYADGTRASYTNFAPGVRGHDCVYIDPRKNGQWGRDDCTNLWFGLDDNTHQFICEFRATIITTTTATTTTTTTTTPLPTTTTTTTTTTPLSTTTTPLPTTTTTTTTTPLPTTTTSLSTTTTTTTTTPLPTTTTPLPTTTATTTTTSPQPTTITTTTPKTTTTTTLLTTKNTSTPPPPTTTTKPQRTNTPRATRPRDTTQTGAPTSTQPACQDLVCELNCGMIGYKKNDVTGCLSCECDD